MMLYRIVNNEFKGFFDPLDKEVDNKEYFEIPKEEWIKLLSGQDHLVSIRYNGNELYLHTREYNEEELMEQFKCFYERERAIVLRILDDYTLGLGITDEEVEQVKEYIKILSNAKQRPVVVRPEIMKRYDDVI